MRSPFNSALYYALCLAVWVATILVPSKSQVALAEDWSQPYFQDDFSGSARKSFFEGVLDGRRFRYDAGEYEIDTMEGSSYGQSILLAEMSNYRVEATGWLESSPGPSDGFGVSFNYSPAEAKGQADFLLFLVYGRGAFAVLKYSEGTTSVLAAPTKTKLFEPGGRVDMAVENRDGEAVCFINGVEACRVRDSELRSGGFGLFCTAESLARFDDFTVYANDVAEHETLFEDFSQKAPLYAGQVNGVGYEYADERYVIDTTKTDYAGLSPFPRQCMDFELSVDVTLLGGSGSGGVGFYIREYEKPAGWFNHFRFLVSGKWFGVEQSLDKRISAVADWRESESLKPGESNRLSVRAQGSRLSFFINGEEAYSLEDAHPQAGAIGLYVAPGLRAAFDNAQITFLDE